MNHTEKCSICGWIKYHRDISGKNNVGTSGTSGTSSGGNSSRSGGCFAPGT